MLRYSLQIGLLVAVTAYAIARGGRPEKQIAATLCAMAALDFGFHWLTGAEGEYGQVDHFHLFNDAWALAVMLFIALQADRFWPLWVASLQVIATLSHFLRVIDLEMLRIVYAIIIRTPFWAQILVLAFGIWNYSRPRMRAADRLTLRKSSRN